jgi:hypothetical protein
MSVKNQNSNISNENRTTHTNPKKNIIKKGSLIPKGNIIKKKKIPPQLKPFPSLEM